MPSRRLTQEGPISPAAVPAPEMPSIREVLFSTALRRDCSLCSK
jgi:hypothetical protein